MDETVHGPSICVFTQALGPNAGWAVGALILKIVSRELQREIL